MVNYKELGKRIKIARIKRNLTQESVADRVNISYTHMSNIETGNTKVSLPTLVKIANVLNASLDEFLCDSIKNSKTVFSSELEEILKDCNSSETKILVEVLKSVKEAIRKEQMFLNNL